MRSSNYLISGVMLVVMLACISNAAFVGSSRIRAPAVVLYNNTGSLTTITLTITTGSGNVSFADSSAVADSTLGSAYAAAQYGSIYAGKNFSKYNFVYTVNDRGINVSGPSAGAAMALLAVSAFEGKPLRADFTITGTIGPDGMVGPIGGALDKVSAAAGGGIKLVLVPWTNPGSVDQGIYYIAQAEYGIPVVEVSDISQAASYAFGSSSGVANEVTMNFSNNYEVGSLPQAQLNCSNSCNEVPFTAFANYTINLTRSQIAALSALPGLGTAEGQLMNIINQTAAIHQKGYLYISADIAFLNYLNAFYLGSYNVSRAGALGRIQDTQLECSSLLAPQLTTNNYDYVIGGELRQGWANYTINATLASYNSSGATQDEIVSTMYSVGEAQAWCGAVAFLYSYSYQGTGAPVTFSQSLAQTAIQRINRAEADTGMYLTLARQAYRQGNYPIAILDADYAYVISGSAPGLTQSRGQLVNQSVALASNSTYGSWATEFAKEALFYAYESTAAKNSTEAQLYADQAYSSAYLASQISNDTRNIYASLVAAPLSSTTSMPTQSLNTTYGPTAVYLLNSLSQQVQELTIIVGIALAILVGCIALIAILAHKIMVLSAKQRRRGRKEIVLSERRRRRARKGK